jgi:glycosyltransferase involved in cell wall biosynthesis
MFGFRTRTPAAARDWGSDQAPIIAVVTPVLNGMPYIDDTIMSILAQAGPFIIRYHVQDGGSTDGTVQRLRDWKRLIDKSFQSLCRKIVFTFESSPDQGLYDATIKGFSAIGPSDYMTWINADDRYENGAFASVAEILGRFEDVRWLGGRPIIMSEGGCLGAFQPLRGFPRRAIAARIFDGRFAPFFLQQEGIFWRRELWEAVGGLRPHFRLAGDFDLWARFAEHTDFVMIDALTGTHRVRAGQLSGTIENYHAEIDAGMDADAAALRAEISAVVSAAKTVEQIQAAGLSSRIAENHIGAGGWHILPWPR